MRRNIVLLATTVVIIVGTFVATLFSDNRPVLGLDLQGGISVVLFPEEGSDLATLGTAADIIRNRVDAIGVAEPEVSVQGETIVVDLPGVRDRARAEELIGQTAELRFRPVVGFYPEIIPETTTTTVGDATTTTTGDGTTTTSAAGGTTTTSAAPDGESLGASISTAPIAAVRPAQEGTTTSTAGATTTTAAGATTTSGPSTTTTTIAPGTPCLELVTARDEDLPEATVVASDKDPEVGCYVLGPTALTGEAVNDARAAFQPGGEGWTVDVEFSGNQFVDQVATPYTGQQVAIVLDGVVQSAPTIQPGITGGEVQISGSFTEGEAKDLALVLRYGSLPVQFDPEEQTTRSVSPSLGRDQLRAGVIAGLIGLGLVALYMIAYYRLLGLVVWFGLGLTALIFFTIVSYLSTASGLTLTLAGVTGIIVSVGVTVDSYVVYFERLKDEVRTGKTIRSSLDVGFHRAFRTILAADLVSLLGATVLYLLAEGSVRGFAFFLGLSTVIDLVIAYSVMHPMVSLIARRPGALRARVVGVAAGLDVPEARA